MAPSSLHDKLGQSTPGSGILGAPAFGKTIQRELNDIGPSNTAQERFDGSVLIGVKLNDDAVRRGIDQDSNRKHFEIIDAVRRIDHLAPAFRQMQLTNWDRGR